MGGVSWLDLSRAEVEKGRNMICICPMIEKKEDYTMSPIEMGISSICVCGSGRNR